MIYGIKELHCRNPNTKKHGNGVAEIQRWNVVRGLSEIVYPNRYESMPVILVQYGESKEFSAC